MISYCPFDPGPDNTREGGGTKKKIIYSNVFIVGVFRFAALTFPTFPFVSPFFSSDDYDFLSFYTVG